MSSALAPQHSIVTPEQIELIRRTVAQGATDDELKLYLHDCARRGVHPLDRLIHFTKRSGKYTPITSIDYMRMRAHSTGACAGISDAAFSGDQASSEFTATVTVKRLVQGAICDFSATARWFEYFPGDHGGTMWRKMPHTMLGKCSEALALRKGFPQELAGLYAKEEMDQAGPSGPQQDTPLPEKPLAPPSRPVPAPKPASSSPVAVARGRFYTLLGHYGCGDWGSDDVLLKIRDYLQQDVRNLLEVDAEQWNMAADSLAQEYGPPMAGYVAKIPPRTTPPTGA